MELEISQPDMELESHFDGMGMTGAEVAGILFEYIDFVRGNEFETFQLWLKEYYPFDVDESKEV